MTQTIIIRTVLVLLVIIWFSCLGHRDLIAPDEARYSEIPREMIASGDWLTPHLNGFKYFEKPALQYWLTAISFKLFGQSNAIARLWMTIAGFLCALFIGFLTSRLKDPSHPDRQAGLFSFVITLTMVAFILFGHILTLDMSVTLFLTLSTGSLILAQLHRHRPQVNRNWMLLGWVAMALAVLSKGLIGVLLPCGAVFFYMLWQRAWQILRHLHIIKGVIVFLLVGAPWFIAVSLVNPEFAHFFFIHEHFERYSTMVDNRPGSIIYFIPVFLLGVSPWLVTALKVIFKPDFSWKPSVNEKFNAQRFIWVYIVMIFLFFSLSHSKLPAYILPIFPFIAVLSSLRLRQQLSLGKEYWTLAVLGIICLISGIIITRFATPTIPAELFAHYRPWIISSALIMLAGAGLMRYWRYLPVPAVLAGGTAMLLSLQFLLVGLQTIAPARSAVAEAAVIRQSVATNVPVYALNFYPQSLPFYLKRTIKLVGTTGELEMGIKADPTNWLPDLQHFAQQWQQHKQAVAIMKKPTYDKLIAMQLPMRLIYKGVSNIVVVRF